MAAKKSKKTVTIEIDVETLQKLVDASAALSELATALVQGADDPTVRSKLKGGKKRR